MADTVVRVEDILGLTNKGGGGAVSLSALGQALTNGAAIVSAFPPPINTIGTTMSIIGISITAYTTVISVVSAITALQPQLEQAVKMVGAFFNPAFIPALAGDLAGQAAAGGAESANSAIDSAVQSLLKFPLFKLRDGQEIETLESDFGIETPSFDSYEAASPDAVAPLSIPSGDNAPYLDELISGPT